MIFAPIRTEKLIPPEDSLDKLINPIIPQLKENMIVVITSKVVSIIEGRCLEIDKIKDKDQLIISEAKLYLERKHVPGKWLMHTIKNNLLIPTAGIDESNSNGYFILWPLNPLKSAEKLLILLREKSKVKNLGIVITDSHSVPLRRGLVGISIAHSGFKPLHDYRGEKDLFGRELEVSMSNIPDSIAAACVLQMGEGDEQIPAVLVSDLPKSIEFVQKKFASGKPFSEFEVPIEEDLFRPFLTAVPWKKGGK